MKTTCYTAGRLFRVPSMFGWVVVARICGISCHSGNGKGVRQACRGPLNDSIFPQPNNLRHEPQIFRASAKRKARTGLCGLSVCTRGTRSTKRDRRNTSMPHRRCCPTHRRRCRQRGSSQSSPDSPTAPTNGRQWQWHSWNYSYSSPCP